MATTSDAKISQGAGINVATYDITEDGETKKLQREVPNASNGEEIFGLQADAGITSDTSGTISGKLRGLVKMFSDVWDSLNHVFNVNLKFLISGEDTTNNLIRVEQRFGYSNVTATGTTVVKSAAGEIHGFSINNPCTLASATTETTIVLYDNTAASGTKIGTFYLPKSANITTALPIFIPFNSPFNTGLTVAITLGTSGSWTPDLTFNIR